jgi:hypothetical protein
VQKIKITNISSVALPFRQANPAEVFLEIKDKTHPLVLVRGGLCLIGGNWIGQVAVNDQNPLGTLRRELVEELTLQGKNVSTSELVDLGLTDRSERYASPRSDARPSQADEVMLMEVISTITEGLVPFGSYINTTTRQAILAADPDSTREGLTTLSCYWPVPMGEEQWRNLVHLQGTYGNLSNESISLIISLDEIIERGISGAFAHEQPLQAFFLAMGLARAREVRIVPGQTSVFVGPPLATYLEYLEQYDIVKLPPNVFPGVAAHQ